MNKPSAMILEYALKNPREYARRKGQPEGFVHPELTEKERKQMIARIYRARNTMIKDERYAEYLKLPQYVAAFAPPKQVTEEERKAHEKEVNDAYRARNRDKLRQQSRDSVRRFRAKIKLKSLEGVPQATDLGMGSALSESPQIPYDAGGSDSGGIAPEV